MVLPAHCIAEMIELGGVSTVSFTTVPNVKEIFADVLKHERTNVIYASVSIITRFFSNFDRNSVLINSFVIAVKSGSASVNT
jgi:hypothetical protein